MFLHTRLEAPELLPEIEAHVVDPADKATASPPPAVLVVDDEPLIRWSLRKGLTNRGHQVGEAGSASQALSLIKADPARFAVIILDYRLPDRKDLSLLREVRAIVPTSTVLMMTAYGDPGMREEALALGARAVVDKPFQVTKFIALVEAALAR